MLTARAIAAEVLPDATMLRMTSPAQHAVVERLRARLTTAQPEHARFVGAPLDLEGLDAVVLGQLWALIRQTAWPTDANPVAKQASQAITSKARELGFVPALDEQAAIEVFKTVPLGAWEDAIEQYGYLACRPPRTLKDEMRRILGMPSQWTQEPLDVYKARALMALADAPEHLADLRLRVQTQYAGSAYRLAELDVLEQLSLPGLLALAGSRNGYYWPPDRLETADPAIALTQEAAYIDFARATFESATRTMDDVHTGRVPYEADRPFTVDDTQVIARAARVAALRDEPWYAEMIVRLLPRTCVAPTAAKTAPSQSLAIALGHSIEGVPTPESVQALREAIAVVRHEGVKKKISRNLKPAERALAARPDMAMRVPLGGKVDKKQQAMLAACLEAGWWQPLQWSSADWRRQLLAGAGIKAITKGLVWVCARTDGTSVSFMLGADNEAAVQLSVDGEFERAQGLPGGTFRLWHPVSAGLSERRAWQQHLASCRLRQPLRQVFREFYRPLAADVELNDSEQFSGHALSIRPLIGLARKEGWQVRKYEGLVRYFGEVRVTFQVSAELYPGLDGACDSMALRFDVRSGRAWRPLPIGHVDEVVYSEACRAVDLLVSVTAFAMDDAATANLPLTAGNLGVGPIADESASGFAPVRTSLHPCLQRDQRLRYLSNLSLGNMARMRREALETVFAAQITAGRVVMDERSIKAGGCSVHLATARVTRDGEAVDLAWPEARAKLSAVPWLPYDEVLLQRVAEAVGLLLASGGDLANEVRAPGAPRRRLV
jgi:hypothetical protein